jgi:hypothetical protein
MCCGYRQEAGGSEDGNEAKDVHGLGLYGRIDWCLNVMKNNLQTFAREDEFENAALTRMDFLN